MDREAFDRKYAARLNRQQQEAVHAVEGPVLEISTVAPVVWGMEAIRLRIS